MITHKYRQASCRSAAALIMYATLLGFPASDRADAQDVTTKSGKLNFAPDYNHVDLATAEVALDGMSIKIGDERRGGLFYSLNVEMTNLAGMVEQSDRFSSNIDSFIAPPAYVYSGVPFTSNRLLRRYNRDTSQPVKPDGSSLSVNIDSNGYYRNFTHIDSDGTTSTSNYSEGCIGHGGVSKYNNNTEFEKSVVVSRVVKPNGETIDYHYLLLYDSSACIIAHRLQSITNSFGYGIHFDYKTNDTRSFDWRVPLRVTAFNQSIDYCADTAISCSFSRSWPSISIDISSSQVNLTDAVGKTISLISADPSNLTVKTNDIENAKYSFSYKHYIGVIPLFPDWTVSSVVRGGASWTYSIMDSSGGSIGTITRTNPLGGISSVDQQLGTHNILKSVDEDYHVDKYVYLSNGLLQYIIKPEGTLDTNGNPVAGYTKLDYDGRGNIVQRTIVPKQGSVLSNIVTSAGFDSACSNSKTCNQPNWTRDERQNQTDFTYDSTHGGLLSEMGPAPAAGAARPLKLNTFAQRSAWIKNSAGALVQSSNPVWLIASSTECQTTAGSNTPVCDASATKKVTTYQYGASGTGEAMLVKGIAVASGGLTLRTCYGYDFVHRMISETKPNANLAICP